MVYDLLLSGITPIIATMDAITNDSDIDIINIRCETTYNLNLFLAAANINVVKDITIITKRILRGISIQFGSV